MSDRETETPRGASRAVYLGSRAVIVPPRDVRIWEVQKIVGGALRFKSSNPSPAPKIGRGSRRQLGAFLL